MLYKFLQVLIIVLSFFYTVNVYADADMFRTIEEVENVDIKGKSPESPLTRNKRIYGSGNPFCVENSLQSCAEIANQLKEPVKNGRPVVSEDIF